MAPMTYGERVVACLSEAGFPPVRVFDGPPRIAEFIPEPPLAVLLKAHDVCGNERIVDPNRYGSGDAFGLWVDLDDLSPEEHRAAGVRLGGFNIRADWFEAVE